LIIIFRTEYEIMLIMIISQIIIKTMQNR